MIHELLFNLWNSPGGSLLADDSDWTHLFELPEFLHPSEQKLLEMIINIGMDYHRITQFTNEIINQDGILKENLVDGDNDKRQNGLYLKAFCNGVQEALEDYQNEIIKLEKRFLDYPQLSLTYILSSIDQYRGLFEQLKLMIHRIRLENLHGCLLMSGLHKYIGCGIDEIEKAANMYLTTMFYQHLCNWIVGGDLVDPYNEFFICDGQVADEHFLYPEQLIENDTICPRKKSKIRRPPPVRKFYINWDMVPSFISKESTEHILFMGRIVWIMSNDPKRDEYTGDYKTKFRRDIWDGKDIEYYNKIQNLGAYNFNGVEFRKIIEECRVKLTKYLWYVMLDEGHLIDHLKMIREYYALGRGELFQQVLAVSDTSLKDVQSDSLLQHINFLFHETARKIYGENDKTYLRFELSFVPGTVSKTTNPWQHLQLNFEIEWPLHILFHPEIMQFYNKLFSYLLRLKKTQVNLFNLWSSHTLSKKRIDRRVWTLRQNLMFLVNNLQYYMQVNVIEAQFSTLLKAVEGANEFEDVIKIHHEFLTNLLAKSFVLSLDEPENIGNKDTLHQVPALKHDTPTTVYKVITKLLALCDEFCVLANSWESDLTEFELEQLEDIQKRADNTIETLLIVVYSLHEKVSGDHLLQLLLHLDFNRYFSKNKVDLNLTSALNIY